MLNKLSKLVNDLIHMYPFFFFLIVIIILFLFNYSKFSSLMYIYFLMGLFVSYFLNTFLKVYFKKPRPRVTKHTRDYSFPSRHAQVFSYILTYFFLIDIYTLFFTLPTYILVIYNRLSKRHHYLEDVIAGTLLGVIIGLVFKVAF